MSYLPKVPEWAEGVYQLERNDPVSGGPLRIDEKGKERGTANKPLIDLANRTEWLKQKYDTAFDNLGWMQLGLWAVGLEVSLPTQIVSFDGSWYRYRGSLDVPHVITGGSPEEDGGVWSGDNPDGVWVDVGEASLREDLRSNDVPGAYLVGLPYGRVGHALTFFTPEMFGAKGDGITDDYAAIQLMLSIAPAGSVFIFDGKKTYYNSFSHGQWTITKPCTLHCNNALFTRKTPTPADAQTAILLISGTFGVKVLGANIDGANSIDYPYKSDGTQATAGRKTSLSQAINYGIYVLNSNDVEITGKLQKCAFNIWFKSSSNIRFNGSLNYGGQVVPNVTPSDLAYGAGVKVSDSSDYDINATGTGNANATVELEPNANDGNVVCRSRDNLSSGLTITNSKNINFKSITKNTSIGTQITQSGSGPIENIRGSSISEGCSWGTLLNQTAGAAYGMESVVIDVQSKGCSSYGLYILNNSALPLKSYDINYIGTGNFSDGAGTSGNDVVVTGDCRGLVRGKSSGAYNAFIVNGTQNASFPPRLSLDVRETVSVAYSVSAGSYADLSGTVTASGHLISAGSNFTTAQILKLGAGGSQGPLNDLIFRTNHLYTLPMPTVFSFNNSIYATLDSGTTNTYTLKMRF